MTDVIQEHIKSLEQRLATEPQTPLFARLASYYLQAGRAADALRLCDDGLALYPFYSTAHLVKGKALVELGMMAEAKHEYVVVHELLPTNEILARLALSIDAGSSADLSIAPVEETVPEPEVTTTSLVIEETVTDETQSLVAEGSAVDIEAAGSPEPPTEQVESVTHDETATLEEDAFGFQAPPAVAEEPPPPSGYETPDFGIEEKPAQVTSEADFSATPEEAAAATPTIEEPVAPTAEYSFGVPQETHPVEFVAAEAPSIPETVEPLPPVAPEDAFGVAIETPPAPPVPEPTPVAVLPVALTPPAPEPAKEEAQQAKEDQTPDWFEAFSQLQQPTAETTEASPAPPAEEENPFAMFGVEQASPAAEGEPYEDFASRTRMELFGTEDTMTLEEYLGASSSAEPPAAHDQIGELAEKLKSSPRITPPVINYSEKASRPASEGDASSGSGFVTPTLAEIYVKQGWFDDAIKAYRALVVNKPAEKEKFELRIAEIEEMKKKQ